MKALPETVRLVTIRFFAAWLWLGIVAAAQPDSSHASAQSEQAAIARVGLPTRAAIASGEYTCSPAHVEIVRERQQRIAAAASVEEARELAIVPARAARRAVAVAATVAPWSRALADARERLDGFETRIDATSTQTGVAAEFGRLVDVDYSQGELLQVADLDAGPSVRGPGRCYYSTGEIIAIVFGFILFIVPGVILLFVLC
ncbi:MAG TPA: hypothetical protein VEL28_15480 [Candidatus Binatia bacterium]|nr:hypothetical protein [Candidatus Binatia bacterium]